MQEVAFKGDCTVCYKRNMKLWSECKGCRVGLCRTCLAEWKQKKRQSGTSDSNTGLMLYQADKCSCGTLLTARGAALYQRKDKVRNLNHICLNHMCLNHMCLNHMCLDHMSPNHMSLNHMCLYHTLPNHMSLNHMSLNHMRLNHMSLLSICSQQLAGC